MIALSEKSKPVVAATSPVVGEHIDEIAKRFYGHMSGIHQGSSQTGGEQRDKVPASESPAKGSLTRERH